MNNENDIREKLRMFYFATSVPINYFENSISIYSLPENIIYINNIIKNSYTIDSMFRNAEKDTEGKVKAFYHMNVYNECFIYIELGINRFIVVGPTLIEKIYEGHINNLIRKHKLSINLKSRLIDFYNKLLVVNNNQYYYCGKLLETLFLNPINKNILKENEKNNAFLPDKYFTNIIKNRETLFHHPPYFLEQELQNKIITGNLKDAVMLLTEINSLKKATLSTDTLRSLKNSIICSITIFSRAAIEGGVQPERAFTLSDACILEIENLNRLTDITEYEYTALEKFVKIVTETSKSKYSSTIQQVLSYIYKNLTNKLTLKEIAAHIYVHPNYLSSLFKKEVGESIIDYIMKTRIEESKYYIRYTNSTISDIAIFYNFCNQSYFTWTFKKYTGLTPQEYRLKYNQQNE